MEEEFLSILKKYEKEYNEKNLISKNCLKVSEQIMGLCNKYGVGIFERMIILESLAQTCFDNLLIQLENNEMDRELLYYSKYKLISINENIILRTKLGKIIESNLKDKKLKMDIGFKNNIGISVSKRFDILKQNNFSCKYCGRSPPEVELELEHIIPKAKGGNDEDNNLTVSCRDCNRGKSSKLLKEDDENGVDKKG